MNKGNTSMHKLKKRLGYLIYTYIPKQTVHIGLTLLSLKGIVQPQKRGVKSARVVPYQSIDLALPSHTIFGHQNPGSVSVSK
jgi:hypothetical protein